MKLTDYVRRIVARWRIIAAAVVAVVAVATVITLMVTPTYESTSRVFVSNSAQIEDVGTQMAAGVYAQQKVLSYAAVASSATMAETVVDDLGLDVSPEALAQEISTSVEFGTVLISLSVTDTDPQRATAVANSILDNYNDVLRRVDSSRGAVAPVTVSVMEYPTSPPSPVSPNIGLNIVAALFAGLLIGIALAALRDVLDDTIKEAEQLAAADIAVIGSVPVRRTTRRQRRKNERSKNGKRTERERLSLVSYTERSADAEAFRQLRLNIRFASIDDSPRTLLVTSSASNEGKTFVSANLAAVYAATGMQVVLVDLDLRRPSLAASLGVERSVGVTNVLLGTSTLAEAIQEVDSNLSLLASGPLPPNPADVLSTRATSELLDRLAKEYDVVILDTPPSGLFVDARQLAALVDGVVVVGRRRRTKLGVISETIRNLRDVGGNVLGLVVNFDKAGRASEYDYYSGRGARPTSRVRGRLPRAS